MSELSPGSLPLNPSGDDTVSLEPHGIERPRRRATDRIAEDADALTRFEQDQLAREFADIERASAALRLGEPALHSWSRTGPPALPRKPRPLWLLIGVLWLSTAIVTVGAVAAIATLAG
ncbi:MAG: hypothetical protein WCA56_05025 [Xanthobacteraceae bacterium]|jgi:hypothetical protein